MSQIVYVALDPATARIIGIFPWLETAKEACLADAGLSTPGVWLPIVWRSVTHAVVADLLDGRSYRVEMHEIQS